MAVCGHPADGMYRRNAAALFCRQHAEAIGPDRVPWGFWDVIVAALPLILSVALAVLAHFLPSSTGTPAAETPTSTKVLVANTVVGLVIYGVILLLIWLVTVRKYHVGWSALGVRRPPGLYFALCDPDSRSVCMSLQRLFRRWSSNSSTAARRRIRR